MEMNNDLNAIVGVHELSDAEMEQVAGGQSVNTGNADNAGVWKKWEDIASGKANYSVPNGTTVKIVGEVRYHNTKKRNYVQVQFKYKGSVKKGWIAASLVGLKR